MQFKLAVHRALYQFIALDSVQSKTFLLFSNDFLYAQESIDESFASMTPFLDKPFSSSASDQMPCYRSARTQERGYGKACFRLCADRQWRTWRKGTWWILESSIDRKG